jgi:hypothetical protein|tara:strand:- start:9761 stop:10663 length:903 start_codon:yes stop_codon:yes gene_type:complete
MDFINGTTLVTLHIRKWSGKITAEDADYNPAGELPPAKLLERGRKPIFPPKALTVFDTLRKQADSLLLAKGVRFMKGIAIHNDHVDDVVTELEKIKAEFDTRLEDVLDNFDRYREDWLLENQEFESVIKRFISKENVLDRFEFEFYLSRIQPMEGYAVPEEKISNQVLHEVSQLCKTEADRLVERRNPIKSDDLKGKLAPMIEKLDTLSFGNGRVLKLLSEFKTLEGAIPEMESFDVDSTIRANVIAFLSTCSSSARLEAVINDSFSVNSMLVGMSHGNVVAQAANNNATQTLAQSGAFF